MDFIRNKTSEMKPQPDSLLDDLTRFVQVIGKDKALLQLFARLAQLPPAQRANEVHFMAEHMAKEGRAPNLVESFRLFADERVFNAAMAALRDRGVRLSLLRD